MGGASRFPLQSLQLRHGGRAERGLVVADNNEKVAAPDHGPRAFGVATIDARDFVGLLRRNTARSRPSGLTIDRFAHAQAPGRERKPRPQPLFLICTTASASSSVIRVRICCSVTPFGCRSLATLRKTS